MTINQLIKKLQKLEKEYPRGTQVTVDWKELQNDDLTFSPIKALDVECAGVRDGDGYTLYRKDGQQVLKHFVVLK